MIEKNINVYPNAFKKLCYLSDLHITFADSLSQKEQINYLEAAFLNRYRKQICRIGIDCPDDQGGVRRKERGERTD